MDANVLCVFTEYFEESNNRLRKTIDLLRNLGPRACEQEIENAEAASNRFESLPNKRQEIPQALNISYNCTFEIFKKSVNHNHWEKKAFQDLMAHLHQQIKYNYVPMMSSKLETLVKNFKQLDHFLTQQNSSRCALEIARQEILLVMDHFRNMTYIQYRRSKINGK